MISDRRIREIIKEEVDALEFFDGINRANGGLTPWGAETKMDRMHPSNASRSSGSIPNGDFRIHSYVDWVKNYKNRGISYSEYMKMEI